MSKTSKKYKDFFGEARHGLSARWFMSILLGIFLIVLVTVVLFSLTTASNNKAAVREGMMIKAKTASDFFSNYITKTYAEYYDSAYLYIENFEDASKLDLQFIDTDGRILISSYSMTSGTMPGTGDIVDALTTGKISDWDGKNPATGEHIMAVSAPMTYSDGQIIGVMRYVTSLKIVDKQNRLAWVGAAAMGAAVMLIVLIMNLVFLRSVVEPVREITGMARRMADGSYGIQIVKKYRDEIGDMVDAINEMSIKISQSEKAQSEFISSVSHELRTPLTAITGWGETLIYDEGLDEDAKRGVGIILREARRLTKMVEELLDFTRMQDGRFTLNAVEMDLAAELEDSIFAYQEILMQDNMRIEYEPTDDEIPLIHGDPERFRQVFFNLFDNAAKYASEGGRITVSTGTDGDSIFVWIRDYGPGIPEDELERVKMRFYKGSSKKRGSGIGLAVCDEIVKYHGGLLTLSNAEGGGTLVTIDIPLEVPYN